jgi:hypothetical protein
MIQALLNLYPSQNIIRMIESRCMGQAVHNGELRNTYKMFVGKPKGKKYVEEVGTDGRIIQKWVLRK